MSKMIDKLSIQNVRLKKWSTYLSDYFDVDGSSLGSYTKQGYRFCLESKTCELDIEGKTVYEYSFLYCVGLRFIDAAADEDEYDDEDEDGNEDAVEPMIVMEAQFQSIYHSGQRIGDEDISEFSEHNVGFNVWPFWRELVQTSSARFGLSENISVPFYQSAEV